VQNAVETKHHLIVAHEVTNLGYDRDALAMMAHAAREEMFSDDIEAIADKGYYKGEEIVACEEAGIPVTVPKPHTSNAAAHGRFDRADFTYFAGDDAYVCPAGARLTYRFTNTEGRKDVALILDGCLWKLFWKSLKSGHSLSFLSQHSDRYQISRLDFSLRTEYTIIPTTKVTRNIASQCVGIREE
jgi:hypothetical protein